MSIFRSCQFKIYQLQSQRQNTVTFAIKTPFRQTFELLEQNLVIVEITII